MCLKHSIRPHHKGVCCLIEVISICFSYVCVVLQGWGLVQTTLVLDIGLSNALVLRPDIENSCFLACHALEFVRFPLDTSLHHGTNMVLKSCVKISPIASQVIEFLRCSS